MEVELLTQQEALARQRVDVASIFAEHHVGLVRLALIMVGDRATAEDVVQEAFTRTHAGRGRLRDADKALAYVRSAVRELPRRQREALTLRYYFDLADQEIADTMGVGASTVRSTIARGLAALARALGEDA
ncbi:RNA polymerase sigma factor [Nonomuraea coxensis DSM 45129]|uniref:RNA polymerase sigma factor n=1 Tax=Nonomuraea coxensis DSM 45129 TaxID=1122611 RepID=A0ABX8UHQ9_9ACTN|nr:sigma factor-like helix-turn-helix DNA-binding protein [Nonomuraea coxensis]QYC45793.1 RNA polymerase sigma factor [Nonomuraea coxensis DSM 45129]